MTLIIDDSELIGEKLKEFLFENTSIRVLGQAKNIKEGLMMFETLRPDIIFLDIQFPDGNSLDLLQQLKRSKPLVTVIVFSNSADEFYKRKFLSLGCDYFLDKSKDFIKIPEIIREILSSGITDKLHE